MTSGLKAPGNRNFDLLIHICPDTLLDIDFNILSDKNSNRPFETYSDVLAGIMRALRFDMRSHNLSDINLPI